MSKVYVVNFSGHNIFQAKKYGELIYLTKGRVHIFLTDRIKYEMIEAMQDYEEDDYLLLCGAPILNVLASSIVLSKFGVCNLLLWDAKEELYVPRTISLGNLEILEKGVDYDGKRDSGFSREAGELQENESRIG